MALPPTRAAESPRSCAGLRAFSGATLWGLSGEGSRTEAGRLTPWCPTSPLSFASTTTTLTTAGGERCVTKKMHGMSTAFFITKCKVVFAFSIVTGTLLLWIVIGACVPVDKKRGAIILHDWDLGSRCKPTNCCRRCDDCVRFMI